MAYIYIYIYILAGNFCQRFVAAPSVESRLKLQRTCWKRFPDNRASRHARGDHFAAGRLQRGLRGHRLPGHQHAWSKLVSAWSSTHLVAGQSNTTSKVRKVATTARAKYARSWNWLWIIYHIEFSHFPETERELERGPHPAPINSTVRFNCLSMRWWGRSVQT